MSDPEMSPSILDGDGLVRDRDSPPPEQKDEIEDDLDLPDEHSQRKRDANKRKRRHEDKHRERRYNTERPNKRARHSRETMPAIKERIKKSEAIQKLEAHRAKQTCPKTLRYNVRPMIRPDEDFKKDINTIRKQAEQKLLEALTRFHYRNIDSNQRQLAKATKHSRTSTATDVNRTKNKAPSHTATNVTVQERVQRIEQQFQLVSNMLSELTERIKKLKPILVYSLSM